MSRCSNWRILSVASTLVLSLALTWNLAIAQPKPSAKGAAKPAAGDTGDAVPKKARGRLPAYYKDIVDAKQRDRIYAIQAEFAAKIEALEAQLKTLTAERDAAVEGVLSAEQKEKLKKTKDEALSKRKKPAADAPSSEDKPSE